MDKNTKNLNISVIATGDEMVKNLQQVFAKNLNADMYYYSNRIDNELRLNRIDLDKVNILVIDSEHVLQKDLDDLSLLNQQKIHPVVIYLASNWSEQHLIELMRSGVNEIIHLPLNGTSQELLDAIERIRQKAYIASSYKSKGKIITFISCKGGAGATFLGINAAYLISEKFNKKVLFIDLHGQYGDAAYYLTDKPGAGNLAEIVSQPYLNSVTIASAATQVSDNYYLLPASNSIEKSSKIMPHHIDTILTVASSEYDYIFLDVSYSLDSIAMRALDRSDVVYIVTQPTLTYLKSLINMLGIFSELSYPSEKIKILMNKYDLESALTNEQIQKLINREIDIQIPCDSSEVDDSLNAGIPLVKLSKSNAVSQSIDNLVETLVNGKIEPKVENFISKILHLKVGWLCR